MEFTENTMLAYGRAMENEAFVSRQDTTMAMTKDLKAPSQRRTVLFGKSEYTSPTDELGPLRDSSDVVGDALTTYEYKWLRAVGNEEFTGAHLWAHDNDLAENSPRTERIHEFINI
ncbi:MAG TPA: hypothetical protein DCR55_12545 [Lentisphaeria bacterium]|nr:hypothetical protein [Lentisphaeria bacterium]